MSDAQNNRLTVGDTVGDFTLEQSDGSTVTLSALASQSSKGVVVYFYPKASTPGCTKQACDFRDNIARLAGAGYTVVGISPDPVDKLATFSENEELSFPLLSDPEKSVIVPWGAWGEKKNYGKVYQGLIRSTVIVDPQLKVTLAQYNVRATGHVERLLRVLLAG